MFAFFSKYISQLLLALLFLGRLAAQDPLSVMPQESAAKSNSVAASEGTQLAARSEESAAILKRLDALEKELKKGVEAQQKGAE